MLTARPSSAAVETQYLDKVSHEDPQLVEAEDKLGGLLVFGLGASLDVSSRARDSDGLICWVCDILLGSKAHKGEKLERTCAAGLLSRTMLRPRGRVSQLYLG